MHALNRRAKRYPEKATSVYTLKNQYLRAVVRAGLAEVGKFTVERITGYYHECACGDSSDYDSYHEYEGSEDDEDDVPGGYVRSWYSREERSSCHGCGSEKTGAPQRSSRVWYLIRLHGHGFHQPGPADPIFDAGAKPIESHDPTNPNLEVPKIGLIIAAQVRCVEMVIEALARETEGERS